MAKTGSPAKAQAAPTGELEPVINDVVLQGRVSGDPDRRELPSGDVLWTFRLVVPRGEASRGRQTVDTLDCAVWAARLQRSVAGWHDGDVVEVHGAVRRRFFRAGASAVSRVEVEVARGRVIRRSGSASARRGSASAGTTSPSPGADAP